MSIILGLLGGIQTKIYIYGGLALAGLLIVLGAYRKGHAAADRANERRAFQSAFDVHRRISDAENYVDLDPDAVRAWLLRRGGGGQGP